MPDKISQLASIIDLLRLYESKTVKAGREIQFLSEQLNCYSSSVDEPSELFKSWTNLLLYLDQGTFTLLDEKKQDQVAKNVLNFVKSDVRLVNILTKHKTIEKIHDKLVELISEDFQSNDISRDCYFVVKYSKVLIALHESKVVNSRQLDRILFSLECYQKFLAQDDKHNELKADIEGISEFLESIESFSKWNSFWDGTSDSREEYEIFQKLVSNINDIISQHTTWTGQVTNILNLWSDIVIFTIDLIKQASEIGGHSCSSALIQHVEQHEITPTP